MKLAVFLLTLSGYVVTIQGFHRVLVPHPGGIGGIFKGPNSETIVKGPDGSVITAEEEGGAVKTGLQPVVVAEDRVIVPVVQEVPVVPASVAPILDVAPLAIAPVAPVLPVVESVAVAHQSITLGTKEPHIIKTELVAAPLVEPDEASDLVGPSGSISTRGSSSIVSGPASTTISEPARALITPVAAVPIAAVASPVVEAVATPLASSVSTSIQTAVLTAGPAALPTASIVPQIATGIVEIAASLSASNLPPPVLLSSQSVSAGLSGRAYSTAETLSLSTPAPYNTLIAGANVQQDYSATQNARTLSLSTPAPYLRAGANLLPQQDYSASLNTGFSGAGYSTLAPVDGTISVSTPAPYSTLRAGGNLQVQPQQDYSASQSFNSAGSSAGIDIAGSLSTAVLGAGAGLQEQPQQDFPASQSLSSAGSSAGFAVTGSLSTPAPYNTVPARADAQQDYSAPTRNYNQRRRNRTRGRVQRPLFTVNSEPQENTVSSIPAENNANRNAQGTDGSWGYQQNVVYGTDSDNVANIQQYSVQGQAADVSVSGPAPSANQRLLSYNSRNLIAVNPSNIPSRNIVPPEIKLPPLPKGAIDLGATVTVTSAPVPQAPGLAGGNTASSDQTYNQVDNVVVYDKGNNKGQVYYAASNFGRSQFTEPNQPDWRGALLRNPNPVDQQSDVNQQLNQQGIDATQINFEQVPLSSAAASPSSFYDVYEDTGLELSNRYGRRSRVNT